MLPVAVLPVAGLLLGIGAARFAVLPAPVSNLMEQAGGAVFTHLPLIFAIAVALAFTRNDSVSAISTAIGYVVLLSTMGEMAVLWGATPKPIMGIPSIDTGVFGGILFGALAAFLFNRYHRISLPPYLAFFAGKRFVPIVTALAAIALGIVLSAVWPVMQSGIDHFSHWAAVSDTRAAATIYGLGERLLIPFGLHHIWNVPFFFEVGTYTDSAGRVVHGDIARFFAGDTSAGVLAGAYLFKMFGLPGAALAMWHTALPEKRQKVRGIMVSAALTSFLTGITEPIEFAFLFAAPGLYVVHALLAASSHFVANSLDIHLGFTFSQGAIDFVAFNVLGRTDSGAWLVGVLGPLYGLVYFATFRFAITKFDLKTPGRDEVTPPPQKVLGEAERSRDLVHAFGGEENITGLDACITRLRINVKDPKQIDAERLKALGAAAVVVVGDAVQAIFGPASEHLKSDMEEYLRFNGPVMRSVPPSVGLEAAAQLARIAQDHGTMAEDLAQSRSRVEKLQRRLERGKRFASFGEVVAGVAHDLRTPITGIKLTLDGLARRSLDDRSAEDVAVCQDELARLDRLVGSLHIVARTVEGKAELELGEIVDERLRQWAAPAALRNVTLSRAGTAHAAGNVDMIVRVVDNLVGNAIDAVAEGGRVTVRLESLANEARIIVEDDGAGVPRELEQEIFEPFFTSKPQGTGLGLFLSRALVAAHGGRLTYHRESSTTSFTVSLPVSSMEESRAVHSGRRG